MKRVYTYLAALGLSAAVSIVALYEGRETNAYADAVGVSTVCYGHTTTASPGDTLTDEECDALFAMDLLVAAAAVDRLVTVPMSVNRRSALTSFVFNVGNGAFSRSTLLRKLNAGDRAACAELDRWVYAGGQRLRGLERRRAAERKLCES